MTHTWSQPKRGWGKGKCIAVLDAGTVDERVCGVEFVKSAPNQKRCPPHTTSAIAMKGMAALSSDPMKRVRILCRGLEG